MLDTSNLASTVVVNIANQYIDPIGDAVGAYRVDKIDYDVDDPLTLILSWGGVPTPFLYLAGRGTMILGHIYGGLQNDEATSVRDGRILATSYGYANPPVSFSVVLWLVKQAFVSTRAAVVDNRITGDSELRVTGDADQRVVLD